MCSKIFISLGLFSPCVFQSKREQMMDWQWVRTLLILVHCNVSSLFSSWKTIRPQLWRFGFSYMNIHPKTCCTSTIWMYTTRTAMKMNERIWYKSCTTSFLLLCFLRLRWWLWVEDVNDMSFLRIPALGVSASQRFLLFIQSFLHHHQSEFWAQWELWSSPSYLNQPFCLCILI